MHSRIDRTLRGEGINLTDHLSHWFSTPATYVNHPGCLNTRVCAHTHVPPRVSRVALRHWHILQVPDPVVRT